MIPVDTFTNPDPPTFESAVPLIQTWIQSCNINHICFKHGLGISTELPTRVIDVGDSSRDPYLYITHGETGQFAALSHCWGPPQMSERLTTTQDNLLANCEGIALDKFPKTFRDAINITRGLGLRYIWIDCLCIIQDSIEDWILEVNRMVDVYQNAYITLAADLAPHSDAGLFVTDGATDAAPQVRHFSQVDDTGVDHKIVVRRGWPRPGKNRHRGDVESSQSCYISEALSKLSSRAWALQENILSARTVHFTNAELLWECGNSYECSCGNPMPRDSMKSIFKAVIRSATGGHHSGETSDSTPNSWHSIVEEFTVRDLTYAKDRLPAISSLARMMPFPKGEYLAGLWKNSLMGDLIWLNPLGDVVWELDDKNDTPRGPDTPKYLKNHRIQGEHAPSWSWASISAPVAFSMENPKGVIPEWRVIEANCMPITTNPYGPVSKDSSLHVEGYLLPVTFSRVTSPTFAVDQSGNKHAAIEICIVRGDEAFPGRNKIFFDAGIGSQEWQVEGYGYFVLVIGCRTDDQVPLGLVLRQRELVGTEEYIRIGFVRLDTWKGQKWNDGAQKRTIAIF